MIRLPISALRRLAFSAVLALTVTGTAIASAVPASDDEPPETPKANTIPNEKPDAVRGLELARKLCASCHMIGDTPPVSPMPADIPSFARLANDPKRNFETLITWLRAPHAPMPDLQLTRKEMGDLAAYILSLKTNE